MDASGVSQQGPDGAAGEGKMATAGMIDNPVPEDATQWANPTAKQRPTEQARYLATLEGQATLVSRSAGQDKAVGTFDPVVRMLHSLISMPYPPEALRCDPIRDAGSR
jgi:hypothetical protein